MAVGHLLKDEMPVVENEFVARAWGVFDLRNNFFLEAADIKIGLVVVCDL